MRIITILLLLTLAPAMRAQNDPEWERQYDGLTRTDAARDIVTDRNGHVYVTGDGFFETDTIRRGVITAKYTAGGELVWLRGLDVDSSSRYGGSYGLHVAVDSGGSVYVAGGITTRPGNDYTLRTFVAKYSSDGTLEWSRPQPNRTQADGQLAEAKGIAVDRAGNVIVAGAGRSATSASDYLLYRYRPNGELAWQRAHNGPASLIDRLHSMAIDAACEIYVTGTVALGENSIDPMTIRYDTSGTIVWRHQLVMPRIEVMKSVQVDGEGNVYVSGYTADAGINDTTTRVFTVKYSPVGDTLWTRRWRGPKVAGSGLAYFNRGYDMRIDAEASVYVLANQNTVNPTPLTLIKYTTDGELVWERTHSSTNGYLPIEMATTSGGGTYVAASRNGTWQMLGYDAEGELAMHGTYNPDSFQTTEERCWGVATDDAGAVYFCGTTAVRGEGDNFAVVRMMSGVSAAGDRRTDNHLAPSLTTLPNPFATSTEIVFTIEQASVVRLSVVDLQGRVMATLVDGPLSRGTHRARFDATALPPGAYLCRLATNQAVAGWSMTRVE